MSKITGKGIPTRKTAGAIGDIYADTSTGKQYKCTNAYGVHGQFDYTWRAIKAEPVQNGKVETKAESKVEKKVEEKPVVTEAKSEEPAEEKVEEPVKEVKADEPVVETEEPPAKGKKRTNYAAAYDKKSK